MSEWLVTMEVAASEAGESVDIESVAELGEALDQYQGSANGGGSSYGAVLKVPGDSESALSEGLKVFFKARASIGLPQWPLVRCEVLESNEFHHLLQERELRSRKEGVEFMNLLIGRSDVSVLGAREATEVLGVSRERFRQLSSRPDFPKPFTRLAATPLWFSTTVQAFAKNRKTTPGRPAVPASWTEETSSVVDAAPSSTRLPANG